MSDLFELRTSAPDNSEEVRGVSGLLLGSPKGKENSGSTGLPLPRSPRKSDGVLFPLPQGSRRQNPEDLRSSGIRLMKEIEVAEALSSRLRATQEPFEDAFMAATGTVEALIHLKKSGTPVTKVRLLAAYDARVTAGHQWNPHRERYKDTLRWLKTLRTELKDINAAIGS